MPLTRPSNAKLAEFMAEPEDLLFTEEGYGKPALDQALDLLVIGSGSDVQPESALDGRIINNGICQLAEAIIRTRPERHMAMSVIGKEVAGNYSYSIVRDKVLSGLPVGLLWFDLAVDKLRDLNSTTVNPSLSTIVFENEHIYADSTGQKVLFGPFQEGTHLRPSLHDPSSWW